MVLAVGKDVARAVVFFDTVGRVFATVDDVPRVTVFVTGAWVAERDATLRVVAERLVFVEFTPDLTTTDGVGVFCDTTLRDEVVRVFVATFLSETVALRFVESVVVRTGVAES